MSFENREPQSANEYYLKQIAENTSGGGGGSSLPEITSGDEGKVLTVVNESGTLAPKWESGGGGIFLVNIQQLDYEDPVSIDKTYSEIAQAKADGQVIFAQVYFYPVGEFIAGVLFDAYSNEFFANHVAFHIEQEDVGDGSVSEIPVPVYIRFGIRVENGETVAYINTYNTQ